MAMKPEQNFIQLFLLSRLLMIGVSVNMCSNKSPYIAQFMLTTSTSQYANIFCKKKSQYANTYIL